MMATKTFSGQLDQAIEGAASGNKLLFVPQENLGEVLMGAASEMTVGDDGTYSITLAYNTYSVYHYSNVTKNKILIADGVEVSASTSVSTIPDLIGVSVPVTDSDVLTNQGYLQEGQDYAASAKTSAEDSDELFNSFNARVGQAIEPIETGAPSLDIPFNDSGILKKGVGAEYVSGLPIYGVDFTRSTASTVINKSGALESLAADEIGIGSDGVCIHGSYTVFPDYTNDIANATYSSPNSTATLSSDTWSGLDVYDLYADDAGSAIFRYLSDQSGNDITAYTIARAGSISTINMGIGGDSDAVVTFDLDAGTYTYVTEPNSGAGMEELSDGFYLCYLSVSGVTSTSTVQKLCEFTATSSSDYVQIAYAGFSNTSYRAPLYVNSGSETTVASTSCTVPVSGNLPSFGQPFTFVFDAEFNSDDDGEYTVFSCASNVASGTILFRKFSGYIQWYHDESDGSDSRIISSNTDYTEGRHRYALLFDGSGFYMYCDGSLVGSTERDDYCWFDSDGDVSFVSTYNNQLKNFKILPYAASADEVKSWGAPK